MEGVMVNVFAGAMNSLLTKLATLLQKEYKMLKDVKKDITSLRGEMSSMNTLLVKLSDLEELDVQDKEWRDKVRELAYDMEDCVDIFMHDIDHGDAKGGLMHGLTTLKARYKIANLIKELMARAVEVSNCHNRYKLSERIGSPRVVTIDPRIQSIYEKATNLVGLDGPKEKLVGFLKEEEGAKELKVVAVVGFGGMGKTTLANQVFDKIKSQFHCTASISLSRNPNMVEILSNVLSKVGSQSHSSLNDVRQLIDILREHLKDKRYLFVIDDIGTKEAWDIIKCSFVENNCGSRIITTTRIEDVAKTCCSCFHGLVYKIKPLNDLDSRRLLHRRVFHSEDACPVQLNKVSDEILKKCEGVPLAILSVASILSSHEEVMVEESWEKIQNYLRSESERNLTLKWMRHVLNLGYNDLSLDLKTCMLYIGIFPEDSEIMKDDLMRRWIAEGFVNEKHPYGPQEIAESYFNELVNRNMIQIAEFDDCGEVVSGRVHDLMLDFIISKSQEENFITIINDWHRTKGSLEVRRLSFQVRNSEYNPMLADMALIQARSFNFWGPGKWMPPLTQFRLLRVLNLEAYASEDKQYDISYICRFFQLRYLRTRGIRYEKTLTQLRKLQHLKTLEIVDGIDYLQLDDLPSTLLHLIVPETVKVLGRIGRMRALCTLATLQLDLEDVENIEGLGELVNIKELKLIINFSLRTFGSLLSSLCKLGICDLQSLTISGFFRHDVLTSWSPPPRHLRRLHVLDCTFSVVPHWIAQLDNLKSLEVEVLSLPRDGAEVLAKLTSLVHLKLHVTDDAPAEGVVIHGAAFPILKEFWFRYKVPCLVFEAGAMPKLQNLTIQCCAYAERQADGVLDGIEHLGSLKACKVDIYRQSDFLPVQWHSLLDNGSLQAGALDYAVCASFDADSPRPMHHSTHTAKQRPKHRGHFLKMKVQSWDMQSLEAALRKAINKHQGSPDVSIITVR